MPANSQTDARPKRSPTEGPDGADAIGSRLREIRLRMGMTLGQLAEATGLSIGSLSQVERGLVSPTIRTVYAIASALGVSPAAVIDPDSASVGTESPYIARAASQPQLIDANGVRKILASPTGQGRYKAYLMTLQPGGSSGEDAYIHAGDEVGYVLRGSFSLEIESKTFVLGEGDCFAFPSSLMHRFYNDGDAPAEIIWINSLS
ncbi:cupin domain-containing protein [Xinfangfangia sp. D13-10-4-6]|uniref:cupin domain-containing protein n=1 Tax=Pseudogemmobacter hezensis TaxID=2737662 RepID=UPI0015560932|nr:cupin domain-containing protein [Pseudogemmobacter hezensis]NPD16794.1 cupin domain-containing protein [Pseudogemmobacter hezensis]